MTRSASIFFGTFFGGLVIYAVLVKLVGLAPKEPGKTIMFVSSYALAAVVSALATRRGCFPIWKLRMENELP